jgi:BON domain
MRKKVFSALVAAAVLLPAAVVTAQSADASAMAQRIGSRLKESGQLRDYRVGIKFIDGVACLTGTVTDPEQAQIAIRLTQQVEGVTHVVNDLTITGASGPSTDRQQQTSGPASQPAASYQARQLPNSLPEDNGPSARNWQADFASATSNHQAPPRLAQPASYPSMPPMQPISRPAPQQMAQRTRQPNNMNNMPVPAHMAAGRQPMRQQPNPMNQQAMAQQAMAQQRGVTQQQANAQQQQAMAQQAMAQRAMAQRAYYAQQAYAQQAMGQGPQRPMPANYMAGGQGMGGPGMGPMPANYVPGGNVRAASYDTAQMPGYAWPSYASYPNYAALSYPQQYSPTAWPYIGPFYPYPQVPLGWRKVSLEWDDGWWFLDFSDRHSAH